MLSIAQCVQLHTMSAASGCCLLLITDRGLVSVYPLNLIKIAERLACSKLTRLNLGYKLLCQGLISAANHQASTLTAARCTAEQDHC